MTDAPLWSRFVALVQRRWGAVLVLALALAGGFGVLASRLELKTDFSELLPRDSQAVRDLHRIEHRIGGLSTLVVGIEGGEWKTREQFADEAVRALRAELPQGEVAFIDYRVTEARAFYEKNKFLYIDLADLRTLRDRLRDKVRDEERRRMVVQLDDEPPARFDADDIRQKYQARAKELDHFPDGYFITPDHTLQALLLRVPSSALGEGSTQKLVDDVARVLDKLRPETRGYRILYGGDPLTALDERQGVVDDLVVVSVATTLLVVLVIVAYYRSARALLLIGVPVGIAIAIAFGVARLTIGSLNSNTGFLGAIIAGNGINFGIVLLARYDEERRAGADVARALSTALSTTWVGTGTAALGASIAYGSLMATDFRGFSQFGFIGAVGMVLCWLVTFAVTPALAFALDGKRVVRRRQQHSDQARGAAADRTVAAFFDRWHRPLVILGAVGAVACAVLAARFYRDPFEYNFHNLRSRRTVHSGAAAVGRRVDKIFEGTSMSAGSPAVFLVDRPDQLRPTVDALEERRRAGAPIGRVESIESMLPADQEAKLALLGEIRRLLDGKVLAWLDDHERREALEYRPPDGLRALGPGDLPEQLERPFLERDGRRGLVIFVYPPTGMDFIREGKTLLRFATAIREVRLPDGEVLRTSGHEVVVADILAEVLRDGPITTVASFAGVLALTALALRRRRDRVLVTLVLVVGVTWMCGAAALVGMKVNMLNFVALPITFGIGVDYPVNLYRRLLLEKGPQRIGRAVRTTGSAVALCSLTTIIGYSSLLFADTRALNSFGLLAVIGEGTTLAGALALLPSLVRWIDPPPRRAASAPPARAEEPRRLGTGTQ
jgi:predicted RND superfamily exporter protein